MSKLGVLVAFLISFVLGPGGAVGIADGGGGLEGHGGAGIGDPGVDAWIAVTIAGGNGSGGGGQGMTGSRYQVVVEPSIHVCRISPDLEWQSYVYLYDSQTVSFVEYLGTFCPGPGGRVVAAALLPVAADIFRLEPIPAPKVRLNPDEKGLAGLVTWGWYEGPETVEVTVSLMGYRISAVAHPTSYRWSFGDGSTDTTVSPGSSSAPSVKHMYQSKGQYTVALATTWSGTYTYAGHGITGGGPLGSVTMSGSMLYPVLEVRSVLVG